MDFYDLAQNRDIARAQGAASQATDQVTNLREQVKLLERRLERLAVVDKAMWTLVRDKLGLSDVELRSMVLEVDASDGQIDGRIGTPTQTCGACGRSTTARHGRCQYCNAELAKEDPFRV
jgi:hypothetical protein